MEMRRQRYVYNLGLLGFVVVLSIVMSEIFCRHYFARDLHLIENPDHRLKSNRYDTNSDGIRSDKEAGEFVERALNIIVLGDSYVYGYRQKAHDTFPQQLEKLARKEFADETINVANFGWVSSSPILSLRLLQDIGGHYNPDIVILCIDMTDFQDDLKYEYILSRPWNLRLFPGLTTLVRKALTRLSRRMGWADSLHKRIFGFPGDRFFVVNQPLDRSLEFCSPLIHNIDEIARFSTEELDARFLVVILPRSFQYSEKECPLNWEKYGYTVLGEYCLEPFRLFEETARTRPYPIHSLLAPFRDTSEFPTCFKRDPHWTKKGNRVAAKAVYEILQDEGLLPAQ